MYSPQFKTLSEWFSYAFKNSDLDEVDRFPVLTTNVDIKPGLRDKGKNIRPTLMHCIVLFK